MDNIGGLGYKLTANVADFKTGMTLSRSELNLVRREMRDSRTDGEKLQQRLDTMTKAFQAGAIDLDTYHRTFVRLNSETEEAKAAAKQYADEQKALAEQQRKAAELTERLATEEEKLAREFQKVAALKPHLSAEAYSRALAELNRRTPEAIAQQQRLDQVQERRTRREQLLAREMERGRQVMRANETATERYEREINDLNKLLRRGAIDLQTHGRAAASARAQLNVHRNAVIGQIPHVGRLHGLITGMPPTYLAAGAAITAAASTMYLFGRAVSHVSDRVHEQMLAIDANAKAAATIGADLQRLNAIQLAGGEMAGMDEGRVNAALQEMTKRIAEASVGAGRAKEVLDQLGFSAQQLATEDPSLIFAKIADKVASIQSPAEQVRVAFKLFGSDGIALVNVLRDGGDGLAEWDRIAKQLGVSLSEIDAAGVEAANDAAERTAKAFDGLYNTLAVELAPAFQQFANQATSYVTILTTGIDAWNDRMFRFSDFVAANNGQLSTMVDLIAKMRSGDVAGAASAAGDFLTGRSASQRVRELRAIREENERIAAQKIQDRDANRQAAAEIAAEEARENNVAGGKDKASEIERLVKLERDLVFELKNGKQAAEERRLIQEGATNGEVLHLRALRMQTEELKRQQAEQAKARDNQSRMAEQAKQKADEIAQRGRQLETSLRTPFESLVAELADVKTLFDAGAIDIGTARRAEAAAKDRFGQSNRSDQPRSAPTATAGSTAAYDEIRRAAATASAKSDSIRQEQLATQKAIQAAAEAQLAALKDLEPQVSL